MFAMTDKKAPHILLVDDDRLVLATLAASVTRAGYTVSSAKNAEEAQELLTGGCRPDLVLLDVRMPGQSGLFLAERLRDLDHIPFLMLSAYSDEQTVQQAIAQGALAFLVKPIDDAQLFPALVAALGRADELSGLRTTRRQLQEALDNERNINVAVGITMVQHGLQRQAAFEQLRRTARSRSIRLTDLATEVIMGSRAYQTSTSSS
nr:response regulator [uncultured Albidiferax sp.]